MYFGMTNKACNCCFGFEYYILKEMSDEYGDRVAPLITEGIEFCDEIITCKDGAKPFEDIGVYKILYHYIKDDEKIDEIIENAKKTKEKLEKFLKDYKAGCPTLSKSEARELQKFMNDTDKYFLSFAYNRMKQKERLMQEARRL